MTTESIVLKNDMPGVEVHIFRTGASIQKFIVPDGCGNLRDVVLGFEKEACYRDDTNPYFGAVVGRVANRIANGSMLIDGKVYNLPKNDGNKHTLHGGTNGFSRKTWDILEEDITKEGNQYVKLWLESPDQDQGFPGKVKATVKYELDKRLPLLRIIIRTTSIDHKTPVNLSQHTYFNLAGHNSNKEILGHELTMENATHWTPLNNERIPTGEIVPVIGTPMDFASKTFDIGERIEDVPGEPPKGYDHNYVLHCLGEVAKQQVGADGMVSSLSCPGLAAELKEPNSRLGLRIYTNAPGLQLYSGNFLDGSLRGTKGDAVYKKHMGLCLETQCFPDCVNQPRFPSCILSPGKTQSHEDIWEFFTF